MQSVAAFYGQETGFVQRVAGDEVWLRFFVPRQEMQMCVHATVAAVTVLAAIGAIDGGRLTVHTASGTCPVTWDDALSPLVTVEQQPPRFGPLLDDLGRRLEPALGLPTGAIDEQRPIRSASVSRAKLIVPVRTAEAVHAAEPDQERLWALCREFETTGAYIFAPHPDQRGDHVVARQFPVDAGYPEDPATGVAAGALAAYLAEASRQPGWSSVEIDQGDAMGRPSVLRARAFADRQGVRRSVVAGRAVLVSREELDPASIA
jgi:PhzF family phenazine biosynthesis protein